MTGKERLQKILDKMKAQGVEDVKPIFGEKAREKTVDELANMCAEMLEAIDRGQHKIRKIFRPNKE
jgi:hypothetical protein